MDKILNSLPDRLNQIDSVSAQLSENSEIQNRTLNGVNVVTKDLTNLLNNNFVEIKEIRSDSFDIFSKVKHSLEYMKELHQDLKSIQDTVYQINLLSLNISIEAVKIGENGKVFASISSEIRELNERAKKRLDTLETKKINGKGVEENSNFIIKSVLPKLETSSKKMEQLLNNKSKPLLELKQIEELNSVLDDTIAKNQELSIELKNITKSFEGVKRTENKDNEDNEEQEKEKNSESKVFKEEILRKEDSNNIISRKLVEF